MSKNTIKGCEPPLLDEIGSGLEALEKDGYTAQVKVLDSGDLAIKFEFGESEQTLEFKKGEWHKEGVIEKTIIDHLNI